YTWLRKTRVFEPVTQFDEDMATTGVDMPNPEQQLLQTADRQLVQQAMSQLPVRFREILILRELEGLSYKQIADVMGVPIGTVMSPLSRARERFRRAAVDLLETRHDHVQCAIAMDGPRTAAGACNHAVIADALEPAPHM